jgi:hypothetical protein
MGQFLGGLFCMAVGFLITAAIVGINPNITLATAGFFAWLPTIIGVIIGLLVWTGGELDLLDVFD